MLQCKKIVSEIEKSSTVVQRARSARRISASVASLQLRNQRLRPRAQSTRVSQILAQSRPKKVTRLRTT